MQASLKSSQFPFFISSPDTHWHSLVLNGPLKRSVKKAIQSHPAFARRSGEFNIAEEARCAHLHPYTHNPKEERGSHWKKNLRPLLRTPAPTMHCTHAPSVEQWQWQREQELCTSEQLARTRRYTKMMKATCLINTKDNGTVESASFIGEWCEAF